jgi:hypothetical protein
MLLYVSSVHTNIIFVTIVCLSTRVVIYSSRYCHDISLNQSHCAFVLSAFSLSGDITVPFGYSNFMIEVSRVQVFMIFLECQLQWWRKVSLSFITLY